MIRNVVSISFFFVVTSLSCSLGQTIEEYIEKWSSVALEQMEEHKIPASIILAQGILESGYGTSKLAQEGNNHFGIKCHDWKGDKIFHDDDQKNECFRKYLSAAESFNDHSLFLVNRSRYSFLFNFSTDDYKSWAKGLKKAGYATNPKYADKLIKLIEQHELYTFDLYFKENRYVQNEETEKILEQPVENKIKENPNKTKYIVAQSGDTFYQLAERFGLTLMQLHNYNDFPPEKDVLIEGDKVYITPKRRASKKHKQIALEENKSLLEVSQTYGVKLKRLIKLNGSRSPEQLMSKGDIVQLR